MRPPRHIREALAKLGISARDVTISVTGGTHVKICIEGAAHAVFASLTPSCPHAHKHIAADIKKVLRCVAQPQQLEHDQSSTAHATRA